MSAKATFVPAVPAVTQVVTPEEPAKVVLELSVEEAEVIYAVTQVIGGSTPNRHAIDRIRLALARAGVTLDRLADKSRGFPSVRHLFSLGGNGLYFIE